MIVTGTEEIVSFLFTKNIKGAVFDIDGTLLDSMGIWDQLGSRYLMSIPKVPEPGLSQILFPLTLEQGVSYLKEHYQLSQSKEEIRNGITNILRTFYEEEVTAKPHVDAFLETLNKYRIPMVLTTVGDKNLAIAALQRLHLLSYFDGLFICEEYQTDKTKPLIYQLAAEHLHTAPDETAVFEDVLTAITTAQKAGFQTVAVYDATSAKDTGKILKTADYYMKNFLTLQD